LFDLYLYNHRARSLSLSLSLSLCLTHTHTHTHMQGANQRSPLRAVLRAPRRAIELLQPHAHLRVVPASSQAAQRVDWFALTRHVCDNVMRTTLWQRHRLRRSCVHNCRSKRGDCQQSRRSRVFARAFLYFVSLLHLPLVYRGRGRCSCVHDTGFSETNKTRMVMRSPCAGAALDPPLWKVPIYVTETSNKL
jgi:hypothetical protein